MKSSLARLLAVLFGLAGVWSTTAHATLPYASGDLLLGVRATNEPGATQDLVVNLGPATRYTQATDPITVPDLGNLGADLNALFSEAGGLAWNARNDVYWGIVGTDLPADPTYTLYVSKPRFSPGAQSEPWPRSSSNSQSVTNSRFRSFISGYKLSEANATSPKATRQSTSATNSYASFTQGGADFGFYSNIEGDFGNGAAGSVLDLYRLAPTTNNPAGQGLLYVGSFQFNTSGGLTFMPAAPTTPLFRLSATTYSGVENAGTIPVTVQRFGVTTGNDTVTLKTSNGSATAGTDYTAQEVTVAFAAGETSKTVGIPVTEISGIQPSRTFSAALSAPSAGELRTPTSAEVTITESTPQNFGSIAFSQSSYLTAPVNNQAQPAAVVVTLTRVNGADGAVSVQLAATGGSLVAGTDYTGLVSPQTVQFAATETSKSVTLQLAALADSKLPGTINLALTNPQGGVTLGQVTSATVSVAARDKVLPTLALTTRGGRVTQSSFSLNGSARDNSSIDRVEVRVNGGPVQLATVTGPVAGKFSFDLSGIALENGLNLVVATPFDASGNAGRSVTLSITYQNSRPALAGTYNGLLTPTGTPSLATTGLVNLTVTSAGTFTGRVTLGAALVPVRGTIDNAGVLHFNVTTTTTAAPTSFPLTSRVGRVTNSYGALALTTGVDTITGTLTDTAESVVLANIATDRATFDGRTSLVDADYLKNRGTYTVIFPARETQTNLTKSDYPQGDGYGTLKVAANGVVTLSGTLADGSIVSASAPLSKNLTWPFFAKLAATGGLISGPVQFDKTQANSDLSGTSLVWLRPAKATARQYPAGWPNGILIDLLGASYAAPTNAAVLANLPAEDPASGNAVLTFSEGKLLQPITKTVNISTRNRVTRTPADTSFTLTLIPATGQFLGTFRHTDNTNTAYKGAIYQKGTTAGGYGFFLSTVPRGGTGESGAVTLQPKSPGAEQ